MLSLLMLGVAVAACKQAGCWAFGKALAATGGHLAAFQRRQVSSMLSPMCPGMVLEAVSNMELKN